MTHERIIPSKLKAYEVIRPTNWKVCHKEDEKMAIISIFIYEQMAY